MKIGPIQFIAIGFENPDFRGQILEELDAVRGKGLIRLIDLLFVAKGRDGNVTIITDSDFDEADLSDYGDSLRTLAGLNGSNGGAGNVNAAPSAYGISPADVKSVLMQMEPGTAAAMVLFEHSWAGGLAEAVRDAGGSLLAQGMLTRDAVMMIGTEMSAIAEAEATIAAAEAVKGAAVLDTLAFVDAAEEAQALMADEAVTTSIAAETLRTLMAVGVVDDSELEPAVLSLVEAGLLSPDIVADAIVRADAAIAAVEDAFAAQTPEDSVMGTR
jgi:uncharacterized membrane protein